MLCSKSGSHAASSILSYTIYEESLCKGRSHSREGGNPDKRLWHLDSRSGSGMTFKRRHCLSDECTVNAHNWYKRRSRPCVSSNLLCLPSFAEGVMRCTAPPFPRRKILVRRGGCQKHLRQTDPQTSTCSDTQSDCSIWEAGHGGARWVSCGCPGPAQTLGARVVRIRHARRRRCPRGAPTLYIIAPPARGPSARGCRRGRAWREASHSFQ